MKSRFIYSYQNRRYLFGILAAICIWTILSGCGESSNTPPEKISSTDTGQAPSAVVPIEVLSTESAGSDAAEKRKQLKLLSRITKGSQEFLEICQVSARTP